MERCVHKPKVHTSNHRKGSSRPSTMDLTYILWYAGSNININILNHERLQQRVQWLLLQFVLLYRWRYLSEIINICNYHFMSKWAQKRPFCPKTKLHIERETTIQHSRSTDHDYEGLDWFVLLCPLTYRSVELLLSLCSSFNH